LIIRALELRNWFSAASSMSLKVHKMERTKLPTSETPEMAEMRGLDLSVSQSLRARLHPLANGRYSVIFDGNLLVGRSRDPECDAARALAAQGITGKLTLCDGKTGVPRTIIDIEKAARLCVKEGPLRFAPYEGRPDRASSREGDVVGDPVPEAA
jgi:hypothetical protein